MDLMFTYLPYLVPTMAPLGALLVCFHLWKMYGSWKPAVEMVVSGVLLASKDVSPLEDKSNLVKLSSYIPVLVFGFAGVAFIFLNVRGVMGLLSLFLYGIPFFAATWRWAKWYKANA